jgi:hypothetical protein
MPDDAAATRALDELAAADIRWGWKGGKTGEVTAGELLSIPKNRKDYEPALDKFSSQVDSLVARKPDSAIAQAFLANTDSGYDRAIRSLATDLRAIEKANFPRELTGKALEYLYSKGNVSPFGGNSLRSMYGKNTKNELTNYLVEAFGPLSPPQRETFLALLPGHEGTIGELAEIARILA